MSLMLTVPPRARIMLRDADQRTRGAYATFPNDIDTIARPAWYIQVGDATYPPGAAGLETPSETFLLQFIGLPFGMGGLTNESPEQESREIVYNTLVYFFQREQLQFSNLLSLEADELSALNAVKWARPSSHTPVALVERQGIEGVFWGCEITLTVQSAFSFEQILIANI